MNQLPAVYFLVCTKELVENSSCATCDSLAPIKDLQKAQTQRCRGHRIWQPQLHLQFLPIKIMNRIWDKRQLLCQCVNTVIKILQQTSTAQTVQESTLADVRPQSSGTDTCFRAQIHKCWAPKIPELSQGTTSFLNVACVPCGSALLCLSWWMAAQATCD